jgi:diguanylate cyclase (GGDEF)-like protein
MPSSRRSAVVGPAITLAIMSAIWFVDTHVTRVPNPGAISFIVVAIAAYIGGIVPGVVSAAISVGFTAVIFSLPGAPFQYAPDNLGRLVVVAFCTPLLAIMMGLLQMRARAALARERAIAAELKPLRAALDQSEISLVVLDHEMRAQFINRAFREFFALPNEIADKKPAFIGLLYWARDHKRYAMPVEQIDGYIAERMALIRRGDEKPVDIRLTDGNVLRFRCKVLADGGRLITYGNVSDLVHSADEYAELATIDGLTGIYNRRHFMARLNGEWTRFQRYARPLSLLMIDVDAFKTVNDQHGHGAGDQVLVYVARACGARKRGPDVVARIGGEEFALLLPETTIEEAHVVAERLRALIAEQPVPCGDDSLRVTVSIGVATSSAGMTEATDLMRLADVALYAAKRGGRNTVRIADATKARGSAPASAA